MELAVHSHANALLAFAHAEGAAQLDLVAQTIFCNQLLQLFHYLTGALDMAGTADANRTFMLYISFYSQSGLFT